MKVYHIANAHLILLEETQLGNGDINVEQKYHKCKSVKYTIDDVGLSAIDRFLIDIKVKENAKELYLLEVANAPLVYNPHTFEQVRAIFITYYAHDKITIH